MVAVRSTFKGRLDLKNTPDGIQTNKEDTRHEIVQLVRKNNKTRVTKTPKEVVGR